MTPRIAFMYDEQQDDCKTGNANRAGRLPRRPCREVRTLAWLKATEAHNKMILADPEDHVAFKASTLLSAHCS